MSGEELYKELVMLVDDNDTDNFIHRRVLEISKFSKNIIVKNSGKSALEYLEENKDNPGMIPDIIFLDINMPVMTGWDFLKRFEELDESLKRKFKIYILSSSIEPMDMKRAQDNKYVIKFLSKPLAKESILSIFI